LQIPEARKRHCLGFVIDFVYKIYMLHKKKHKNMETLQWYVTITSGIILCIVGIYWKRLWQRIIESIRSEISFSSTLLGILLFVITGVVYNKTTNHHMMIIPILIGFTGISSCVFGIVFDGIVGIALLLISIGIAWFGYVSTHTGQPLLFFIGILLFSIGIGIRHFYMKRNAHQKLLLN